MYEEIINRVDTYMDEYYPELRGNPYVNYKGYWEYGVIEFTFTYEERKIMVQRFSLHEMTPRKDNAFNQTIEELIAYSEFLSGPDGSDERIVISNGYTRVNDQLGSTYNYLKQTEYGNWLEISIDYDRKRIEVEVLCGTFGISWAEYEKVTLRYTYENLEQVLTEIEQDVKQVYYEFITFDQTLTELKNRFLNEQSEKRQFTQ